MQNRDAYLAVYEVSKRMSVPDNTIRIIANRFKEKPWAASLTEMLGPILWEDDEPYWDKAEFEQWMLSLMGHVASKFVSPEVIYEYKK